MAIPTEITETWDFLHREVVWLHGRWSMYEQLFGTSERRIQALNQVAPTFFGTLQTVLLDEVQLTLSRLGDPARSGRRSNLTLETLVEEIGKIPEPDLAARLVVLLEEFRVTCEQIVLRRNRRIAHYDVSTHRSAEGLAGASREEVDRVLGALRSFMTTVYAYYMNSHMAYELFVLNDDANHMVRAVAQALRYRELIETGSIEEMDFVSSNHARI